MAGIAVPGGGIFPRTKESALMTIRAIDETFSRKMLKADDDQRVYGLRMSAEDAHKLMDVIDEDLLSPLDEAGLLVTALVRAAGNTKVSGEPHYLVLRIEP